MKTLKFNFSIFMLLGVFLSACNKSPEAIDYGNDACHFCQMTIVDKIHGAELVTDKGKLFKFDSAECLLHYHKSLNNTQGYLFLTNHFENPEVLIPVSEAKFLISENLPSPMGAYLTAFRTDASIALIKEEKGGEVYDWESLKKHLNY